MENNIVWHQTNNDNNYYASVDLSTAGDYYVVYDGNSSNPYNVYNGIISSPSYGSATISEHIYKPTTKDVLDTMDIKEIEQYIRNKKLEAINKKTK